MQFKVGDIVSILHQVGKYSILEINHTKITIQDEHGFTYKIDSSALVPQRSISVLGLESFKKDNEISTQKWQIQKSKNDYFEIDLHIESLTKQDSNLTAHEKFLLQLNSFKNFANEMIDKRQKKFRIVHGAGEGKLKNEIRGMLSTKKGFTMHDDQYSFGRVGASIIEIKLSVAEKF